MQLSLKIKLSLAIAIAILLFPHSLKAATLELALEKDIVSAKEDIAILVTINSENQDVNTAQATITFPANLLEVIKTDITGSIFSFWLEDPTFDNSKGTIRFVGGSTSGFNGPGLKVFRIAFKVKGSGTGKIGVTDGAITASDGTGSNVYTTSKGLEINIPTTSEFQAVKVERATAAATIASALPARMGLNVPFYPDPLKWNNRSSSFQATWKIGSDVIDAAISLNGNPNSIPESTASAMSGSKIFPALSDGVWYIHLRVKNNIGWSPTLHYRIAIDTAPPNPFRITTPGDFKTNDPMPTINFVSSDLVSGISTYTVYLDGVTIATTDKTTYKFKPLLPGVHQLTVSAVDRAGNSISQTETLEILPIASPKITYVNRQVIVDEGGIVAGGTATIGEDVIAQVQNSQKQIVFEQVVPVDPNGNWNITINKSLSLGDYHLLATSRNKEMSSSFPAVSETIKVKMRPILVLGGLEINQTWFFTILILIILISFAAGWFNYYRWRGQLGRRIVIAQRDVVNVIDNLNNDIDKLLKNYTSGKGEESALAETEYTLKEMKGNLEKSRRYVVGNIRKIND